MIKANELRLGNIVDYFSESADHWFYAKEVTANDIACIELGMADHAEGVTLTGEWLLKFGFKQTEAINNEGIEFAYEISKWGRICLRNGELVTDEYYFLTGLTQKIIYVHQLQNLYFALTGEELKIIT